MIRVLIRSGAHLTFFWGGDRQGNCFVRVAAPPRSPRRGSARPAARSSTTQAYRPTGRRRRFGAAVAGASAGRRPVAAALGRRSRGAVSRSAAGGRHDRGSRARNRRLKFLAESRRHAVGGHPGATTREGPRYLRTLQAHNVPAARKAPRARQPARHRADTDDEYTTKVGDVRVAYDEVTSRYRQPGGMSDVRRDSG